MKPSKNRVTFLRKKKLRTSNLNHFQLVVVILQAKQNKFFGEDFDFRCFFHWIRLVIHLAFLVFLFGFPIPSFSRMLQVHLSQ